MSWPSFFKFLARRSMNGGTRGRDRSRSVSAVTSGSTRRTWLSGCKPTRRRHERRRGAALMAHIQRRAKDRWRARYIDPNGYERSRTFSRKVDAEKFLATVE